MPSGDKVVLTWLSNAAGFTLQFTTNLDSPVAWTTASSAPVVVNEQNAVTNPIPRHSEVLRVKPVIKGITTTLINARG